MSQHSVDPCREGQINALDRVEKESAQFTNHTKKSDWETLAQLRTIARSCALFKEAWKSPYTRQVARAFLFEYG